MKPWVTISHGTKRAKPAARKDSAKVQAEAKANIRKADALYRKAGVKPN